MASIAAVVVLLVGGGAWLATRSSTTTTSSASSAPSTTARPGDSIVSPPTKAPSTGSTSPTTTSPSSPGGTSGPATTTVPGSTRGGGPAPGSGGTGGTSPAGSQLASMTPAEALAAVEDALQHATSVTYSSTNSVTGQGSATQVGWAGTTSGYQTNHFPTGTLSVLVVNGAVYCMGDVGSLENQLGLSAQDAATYAGRWISLAPTDPPTAAVGGGVILSDLITETLGGATGSSGGSSGVSVTATAISAPHAVGGVEEVTVSLSISVGTNTPGATSTQGTAELVVPASAPYLPVSETVTATAQGPTGNATGTSTVSFSSWNSPSTLPTPTNVVSYATIPSAQ